MYRKIEEIYHEFPSKFWVLVTVYFIDRVGGALIFPFLSLYIIGKFGVSMTQVGILLGIHSTFAFIGNLLGGALTDKFGRKSMLIFGLISSASAALALGLVQDWKVFYVLISLTGFVSNIGDPAASAMMADILPIEKRTDGYGILRVAINLAVTIGPAIGGLLAGFSFLWLFILDCVISYLAAFLVFTSLPETKPVSAEGQRPLIRSISGYGKVFGDRLFIVIVSLTALTAVVYLQMSSSLPVFLQSLHGITPQQFGIILSLNAVMVVALQFSFTRQVKKFQPLYMMALGNLFYAIGFAMYGFVSSYGLFLAAMIVITVGEMVIAPVIQTLVAFMAPRDMRGRYMAAFQLGRGFAAAVGPIAAGIILDGDNPQWIWYVGGMICILVATGYLHLKNKVGKKFVSLGEIIRIEVGSD